MKPASAFLTMWARSHDYRGRTSRREFLRFCMFAAISFVAIVALIVAILPLEHQGSAILIVLLAYYIPFLPAAVRRMHDVGERGDLVFEPLKPLAILAFVILLWEYPMFFLGGLPEITRLFAFVFYFLIIPIIFGTVLFMLTSFSAKFAHAMGLLLLPSQPGPNSFGPNPNEVPS